MVVKLPVAFAVVIGPFAAVSIAGAASSGHGTSVLANDVASNGA